MNNTDDDLTQLDILLAGPTHTPFAGGLFKLHLTIPPTYPQAPPTAHFRTPIFHPNVEAQTGGVCVETLKRDWDAKLTLRDILVVISCLLIQPNPDSALNAEAGGLIQDDYDAFVRRAELMTGIHAQVPPELADAVRQAQRREQVEEEEQIEVLDSSAAPPRRRRLGATARQRGTVAGRSEGFPNAAPNRRRAAPAQPFVVQSGHDDVFGGAERFSTDRSSTKSVSDDEENQENDASRSPAKVHTPRVPTPRRPQGPPIPIGELTMEDLLSDSDEEMIEEYPPSPRKSPSKSARKAPRTPDPFNRAESSRDALLRAPNITPPNLFDQPLAESSPIAVDDPTPSPRKARMKRPMSPGRAPVFGPPQGRGGVVKTASPTSADKRREERQRQEELNARLWEACGRDVKRWNKGEFEVGLVRMKAGRW